MIADFPWLRRLVFECTGLAGGGSKTFVSTGKPPTGKDDGYRLSATICKSILGIANASQLQFYNLSEETRNRFQRNDTQITVSAGWDEGPIAVTKCFHGEVLSAESYRKGEDIVTHVSCISSFQALSEHYRTNTWVRIPVRDVVLDLAKQLTGEDNSGRVKGITADIGKNGWSFSGLVKTALDELASEYQFSWAIVDGKFQAVGEKSMLAKTATIAAPYLIAVNPLLVGPRQHVRDVSWISTFNPGVRPGYGTEIRPRLSQHGGTYRVNTVYHNLDPYDKRSFTTTGVASMLGKQNG